MADTEFEARFRLAAFAWLEERTRGGEALVTWADLVRGVTFEGKHLPLITQRGIWRPVALRGRVFTIVTSPKNPYADAFTDDGCVNYHYFGEDPRHPDNVALRDAQAEGTPLIYLHGVLKGEYLAVWPVFVVGEDPRAKTFQVIADERALVAPERFAVHHLRWQAPDSEAPLRRRYAMREVRQRLHQRTFRERVLRAYQSRCALCRLRHPELLDAAHIVADSSERGIADVTNGLALCKIHHSSYDEHLIGIRSDYRVVVRKDVLDERDGPMLKVGLQGLHQQLITVPRQASLRPDPQRLDERFEEFRRRAG